MRAEFEIGSVQYAINKIPAKPALHIVRRLSPLVPALIPILTASRDAAQREGRDLTLADVIGQIFEEPHFLLPLTSFLSSTDDETVDAIMGGCLSYVERFQGGGWTCVWNKTANTLQFADIEWSTMIEILIRVISDQFLPFMFGLDISRSASPTTAA